MKKVLFHLLFIIFCFTNLRAAHIDTLLVESRSMNKSIPNLVILPDAYDAQKQPFPVLYLLHGASGDFMDWLNKVPALKQYVDQYNFIIVCPDGGYTSWYFDSPIDEKMQYETYIADELVTNVDEKYNTFQDPAKRAISGLSMGGHGAFYLAFRHQEIWRAAGSTSGGLDIRPFPDSWDLPKRLGTYSEHRENWEQNTVINMIYLLDGKNLKIIFDCGVDDFFYDANKRMHEKLLERNIHHDYIERPGSHNTEYWANSIKYQLLFFKEFFSSND